MATPARAQRDGAIPSLSHRRPQHSILPHLLIIQEKYKQVADRSRANIGFFEAAAANCNSRTSRNLNIIRLADRGTKRCMPVAGVTSVTRDILLAVNFVTCMIDRKQCSITPLWRHSDSDAWLAIVPACRYYK